MTHDTLNNKSYKIPDLHVRNPHAWYPADFDNIRMDPLLDPLEGEAQREIWGDHIADPNYFATAIDEEDVNYGSKLGSLAVGLDKEIDSEDEDRETEPSDDEEAHKDIEGEHGNSQ